jgi:hypothetical protein
MILAIALCFCLFSYCRHRDQSKLRAINVLNTGLTTRATVLGCEEIRSNYQHWHTVYVTTFIFIDGSGNNVKGTGVLKGKSLEDYAKNRQVEICYIEGRPEISAILDTKSPYYLI